MVARLLDRGPVPPPPVPYVQCPRSESSTARGSRLATLLSTGVPVKGRTETGDDGADRRVCAPRTGDPSLSGQGRCHTGDSKLQGSTPVPEGLSWGPSYGTRSLV